MDPRGSPSLSEGLSLSVASARLYPFLLRWKLHGRWPVAPASNHLERDPAPGPRDVDPRVDPSDPGRRRLARLVGRLLARHWLRARRRPDPDAGAGRMR